eukprot:2733681-Pyramimonas_sp.AAC.1
MQAALASMDTHAAAPRPPHLARRPIGPRTRGPADLSPPRHPEQGAPPAVTASLLTSPSPCCRRTRTRPPPPRLRTLARLRRRPPSRRSRPS